MNIVIVSAFRNCASRVEKYFAQVNSLRQHAGEGSRVRVVAVEGDSRDTTEVMILTRAKLSNIPVDLVKHNHGQRMFGSTEEVDRLSALTGVMKAGMSSVDPDRDDVVLYVESDLIWHHHQVGTLIDLAERRQFGFDVVAPLVFAGKLFYDVWAFRKNGTRFSPFPPYHPDLQPLTITEVDSVGSCLAFRSNLARDVVPIGEEGLISWCRGAKQQGYRIGVASDFRVEHPA